MPDVGNTSPNSPPADPALVVPVERFGVFPDGTDATAGVRAALAYCRTHSVASLVFSPGRYDFYPEFAGDFYLHVCNNDEGLKRVVFALVGFREFTIAGQDSRFVFHGLLNPFYISESSSITLKGFSVDFHRSFHSEGRILAVGGEGMDLHIPEAFPYEISGGLLRFTGHGATDEGSTPAWKDELYGSSHLLEFDPDKRETAYKAEDYYFKGTASYTARELGERRVRLLVPGLRGTPGNSMVFGPNHRNHPAFILHRSRDLRLDSVAIHHAGGMGILGQLCHNISIDHCRVTPSAGRLMSTTADATHFVNCTGEIRLTDNLFENQGDDAANIHGVYVQIAGILDTQEILVRFVHPQQYGFDFIQEGLEVEFVEAGSLKQTGEGMVMRKEPLNKEFTKVYLQDPVPGGVKVGDVMASSGNYAEVTITGNTIRNNRARGMLLNCRGKTRVANNYFHTPGAAILFEGDACHWFEQGGVRDCIIEENTFDNCLYGVWGKAVIDVQPGIHADRESSRYNRNIVIRKNRFICSPQRPLLHAFCVDSLQWLDNHVEASQKYPAVANPEKPFNISFCSNVSIEDDLYAS